MIGHAAPFAQAGESTRCRRRRAGRDRAARGRGCDWSRAPGPPRRVSASSTRKPCAASEARRKRRICGSSSITSTSGPRSLVTPFAPPGSGERRRFAGGGAHAEQRTASRRGSRARSSRRARRDAAADREAEPDARPPRARAAHEFLEDARLAAGAGGRARDPRPRSRLPSTPRIARDLDRRSVGRRVLGAFSSRFTSSCSISTGSTESSGRSGSSATRTSRPRERLLERVSAEPTISSSGTHSRRSATAPDSSRVMSSRLATRRSRRSASSQIVSTQLAAARRRRAPRRSRSELAAPVIAASGVRRSCETAASSELRISSVRARSEAALGSLGQHGALERERRLAAEGVEKPRWSAPSGARSFRSKREHADRLARRPERNASERAPGQRVRAAPAMRACSSAQRATASSLRVERRAAPDAQRGSSSLRARIEGEHCGAASKVARGVAGDALRGVGLVDARCRARSRARAARPCAPRARAPPAPAGAVRSRERR